MFELRYERWIVGVNWMNEEREKILGKMNNLCKGFVVGGIMIIIV